jgi:hypothetical protein
MIASHVKDIVEDMEMELRERRDEEGEGDDDNDMFWVLRRDGREAGTSDC